MASSAVLGRVLGTLLEDYDIFDETTLADLIVDTDVAADIARRLRGDDFAAKLCAANAIARGMELLESPMCTDACVATDSCLMRDIGSTATFSPSGERLVTTASQTKMRMVPQVHKSTQCCVRTTDAAVHAAVHMAGDT